MLFLRPTESLTVFLQQLGRGLRLSDGKEALTVLDFVGQAHKQYSFEDRFKALLSRTRKTVEHEIKNGFANVPRGCSIQLEKQAQDYILENIRNAVNNKKNLIGKLHDFMDIKGDLRSGSSLKVTMSHRKTSKQEGHCSWLGRSDWFTEELYGEPRAGALASLCAGAVIVHQFQALDSFYADDFTPDPEGQRHVGALITSGGSNHALHVLLHGLGKGFGGSGKTVCFYRRGHLLGH